MRLMLTVSLVSLIFAGAEAAEPTAAADAKAAAVDAKAAAAEAKAAAAEAKAAAKARAKQIKEWRKVYGDGPYPDELAAYTAPYPERLRPYYQTLYVDGERNAVINLERLGLAAMEAGAYGEAERAFDLALDRIEAIYANDDQAKKAKSVWTKEAIKEFKGEPYERAMAYYYRGLLYLRAGDYENARASFKSGEYQDTVSEAEEFQGDFAILNYLSGWASRCAGSESQASEFFAQAGKMQLGLMAPPAGHTHLVITEMGRGPVKAKAGKQNELLTFQSASDYDENAAVIAIRDAKNNLIDTAGTQSATSILYQATTRGGRPIDSIMAGKANFKSTTAAIGKAGTDIGMNVMLTGAYTSNNDMMGAGAVLGLVGMFSSMASSSVKADADIRMWDTLPDTIGVTTLNPLAEDASLASSYVRASAPTGLTTKPLMTAKAGACSLSWFRSRSALSAAPAVPGDDPKLAEKRAKSKQAKQRDTAFRSQLMADATAIAPTSSDGAR